MKFSQACLLSISTMFAGASITQHHYQSREKQLAAMLLASLPPLPQEETEEQETEDSAGPQVRAWRIPLEGDEWTEMDRRGAVGKALIHVAQRVDFPSLERTAANIVRGSDGELTQLEQRALMALGFDISALFPHPESVEYELWKVAALGGETPMPTNSAVWPQGLQPNGLGRTQELVPVTNVNDTWDNHPDHPRNPKFWQDLDNTGDIPQEEDQ